MSKETINKTVTKKKTKSTTPTEAANETKNLEVVAETNTTKKESDGAKAAKDVKKIRETSDKIISEKAVLEWLIISQQGYHPQAYLDSSNSRQ